MEAQNPKEWLRLLRERLNLTAAELATKLEISRMTIHRWESLDGKPSLTHASRLAKLAKTSVDEVAGIFA